LKKSLLKAGGWMKYKNYYNITRKLGFTIIESLVYIFLTTMILAGGISLYISMYRSYIETAKITIKYNNYQSFFINLDSIISEGCLEKIVVNDNYVLFSKSYKSDDLDKVIKSNEGKIYVKYIKNNTVETINTMLDNIDNLEIKKNGKLTYFIVRDKEGTEFIRCI
jgi:hypothetical protein